MLFAAYGFWVESLLISILVSERMFVRLKPWTSESMSIMLLLSCILIRLR